jgi:type IV secretory pathway VirB2 component (pilin)
MNDLRDLILSPQEAARLHDGFVTVARGLSRVMPMIAVALLITVFQDKAWGGTSAVFDDLATETEGAVFGPLGQSVVFVGALAGGIIALLKGAWLFAAMGIAIAGLMYGSQVVAGASTFSALLPGVAG